MLVPPHLRPHITPSIRRIYLDEPNPHIDKAMPNATALSECARLTAENNALRINGGMWCKRAQLHAAATIGLLHLARAARDQAIKLRREKEELEQNLNVLKRKIEAEEYATQLLVRVRTDERKHSSFRKFSPPSSSKSLPSSSPNIHTSSDPSISIPQDSSRARTETHLPIHTRVPKFSCQTPLGCLTNEEIAILEEPPSKRRRILPES